MSTWALLFAGLTNAHVHLCFDGQEAPAAVHVAEHGDHLREHDRGDGEHDDVDVDVPNQGLTKAFQQDLFAVAPHATVGIRHAAATEPIAEPASGPPSQPAPPYLRPPLRAPPR
jgi:hypothetical protein